MGLNSLKLCLLETGNPFRHLLLNNVSCEEAPQNSTKVRCLTHTIDRKAKKTDTLNSTIPVFFGHAKWPQQDATTTGLGFIGCRVYLQT